MSTQNELETDEKHIIQKTREQEALQLLKDNLGIEIQPTIPEKARNKMPVSVTLFQGLKPMIDALKASKITGPVLRALLLDAMFKAGLMPTVYQNAVKKELEDAGHLLVKFLSSRKYKKVMKECIDLLDDYD
ncbi:MAG: hypothetical protein ACFFBD_03660 [Candidatus Hodarchaeota archaeon]